MCAAIDLLFDHLRYLMPLVHAEDLELQKLCVDMYQKLYEEVEHTQSEVKMMFERFCRISKVHYNSVLVFGRFPERNVYLKRKNTYEEDIYMQNTMVMREEY